MVQSMACRGFDGCIPGTTDIVPMNLGVSLGRLGVLHQLMGRRFSAVYAAASMDEKHAQADPEVVRQ